MDVMAAVSMILSARLLFLLALAGAFILAAGAMFQPTWMRLGVFALYGFFAVGPSALIAWRQGAMH